jgi:hypothetical protein
MSKKKQSAALWVACMMVAAAPMAQAHQTGSVGAEKSDFVSLILALLVGPKGPLPPPG